MIYMRHLMSKLVLIIIDSLYLIGIDIQQVIISYFNLEKIL